MKTEKSDQGILIYEKEKQCVEDDLFAPMQKEATNTRDRVRLLKVLEDLNPEEFDGFKWYLQDRDLLVGLPCIPRSLLEKSDMFGLVDLMLQTYGQQSVEVTKTVFREISRNDLVQVLSGSKEKHSGDEHLSALIHKVATVRAVKELLVETLNDLSSKQLKKFKWLLQFTFFQRSLPPFSWSRLQEADGADLVEMIVELCGRQSVEVTQEIFMDMNRTDLVQRLAETSSGPKKEHCVDEHWPALTQKVETMASVIELLLETLTDLSEEELERFKHVLLCQTDFYRRFLDIPWMLLDITDMQDTVFSMLLTYDQQAVKNTKEVLKKMNRTDLVKRLSDSSAAPKKKHSDEHRPALIQKVATMAAVRDLLLETLHRLSKKELKKFKEFLQLIVSQKNLPDVTLLLRHTVDRAEIVDQLVETYSKKSLEFTMEVLKKMRKTHLMPRLSKSSSGLKEKQSVDEHQPALSERVQNEAVKQILLETLDNLSVKEIIEFKELMEFKELISSKKRLPDLSWAPEPYLIDVLVDLIVKTCGQQSVEVTKEVLMDMNKTDLLKRLSETRSGLTEKHWSKRIHKDLIMKPVQEKLLETLEDLSYGELEKFKHVLQYTKTKTGLPSIPRQRMEGMADRAEIVELMVEIYGQQSVEVTSEVFKKMNRRDLVERLSEISSGSKGPSRSLETEGGGSVLQVSSYWTKLEPEVNSTDADESPTYNLQSEAGNFECGVSGLRWVCKQKVSFKYQFCSWEEPMERMESIKYMAAGPLIDIKVIAGKLDEVYLPHWICIHDNPTLSDKFAVLHIDDCGDVVEKVPEVTSSHVKLSEPIFSPRAVLMKVGLKVKINCNVLIYKTNTAFLTLHVYLIPRDPGLQQEMDKRELSHGYKVIRKPHPETSLRMRNRFILTADLDGAEIYPEDLKLRYESRIQNFFEVFIENPDSNFVLRLKQKNELQPVWTCAIRKNEYQSTSAPTQVDYQNPGDCEAAESTGPRDVATGREKQCVEYDLFAPMQKEATNTRDRVRLLKVLEDLNPEEFDGFKWYLRDRDLLVGLPCIPRSLLGKSDMFGLVDLMLQTYGQQSVEVTKTVFREISRNDLVQVLSGSKSKL